MEGVLSDGMCRCCATEGNFKDFQVPYQWMGVEEIYGNMLKDCFDITLSVSEDMNNGGICEVCITQLRNACNFKQQVQRTEEKFQKKLQEGTFKTDVIKMEVSRFEDDDSNMSGDDFSSQEYEVPIKVEKVEEKPKKRAAAKASTSKAKKSKTSDGEPSVKRVQRQLVIKSEISDDIKKLPFNDTNIEEIVTSKGSEIVTATVELPDVTTDPNVLETVRETTPIQSNNLTTLKIPNDTSVKGPNIKKKLSKITEKKKHYTNLDTIMTNSTATPIRSYDGFNFMCCFCTGQYSNAAELKNHTLLTHDNIIDKREYMRKQCTHYYLLKLDITLMKCKICDENIDTIDGLLDHLQNEHNKPIYMDVKNHIIPFKFGEEELKCAVCSLAFSKFKVLLEHMHTHYRNYVCDVCDYGCINRSRMYHHKESHNTGSFTCSKCNKVFETRASLRKHMNKVHIFMNMPYKCGICKERFKGGPMKDKHMVTAHGMSPVIRKCLACDKTFTTQKWLRLHTKRFHLMEKLYPCTECDMKFSTGAQLRNHTLKHTGIRDFKCDLCNKCFTTNKILKEHMKRVHTKHQFPCTECNMSFSTGAELKNHILKHTATLKRDFQCGVCLKWFTTSKILKEHVTRIHVKHRPLTCSLCGRGFVQKRSWISHMRTVHGEIDDKAISST